nr:transposase [Acrocarpospora phusangensis]
MEDQLHALGWVLNAIVLWTTRYIDAAVAQFQAEATRSARRTLPGFPRSSTQFEPARPLRLHRQRPGRRRPTTAARPGRAWPGRGRRSRGASTLLGIYRTPSAARA